MPDWITISNGILVASRRNEDVQMWMNASIRSGRNRYWTALADTDRLIVLLQRQNGHLFILVRKDLLE